MIQTYFQLQRRPFGSVPSPDQYFPASSIEAARASIVRLVERHEGPAIVVGAVGIGKSLLCQTVGESFRHLCRVVVLPSGRLCTRRALLQVILYELGLPYREMEESELRLYLIDHVTNKLICPQGILLLVDEADALPMPLLDELRSLTNLSHEGQAIVRLVLFGGLRLEEKFSHPRLESFNQRLAGRFYLEPFQHDETVAYIRQQFTDCGGDPRNVFRDAGLDAIHQATGGIPRLVNQLTDHALILVAIGEHPIVDEACVEEAWAELQQLPLPSRQHGNSGGSTRLPDTIEFGGELSDDTVDRGLLAESRLQAIEEQISLFEFDEATSHDEASAAERLNLTPTPRPTTTPEVTLYFHAPHNPFGEDYAEEEIVTDAFRQRPSRAPHKKPISLNFTPSTETKATPPQPSSSVIPPPELEEARAPESESNSPSQPSTELSSTEPASPLESDLANSEPVAEVPTPSSTPQFDRQQSEAILRALANDSQFIVEPEYQRHARDLSQRPTTPTATPPESAISVPSVSPRLERNVVAPVNSDPRQEPLITPRPTAKASSWSESTITPGTPSITAVATPKTPSAEDTRDSTHEAVSHAPVEINRVSEHLAVTAPTVAETAVTVPETIASAPTPSTELNRAPDDLKGHNYRRLFSHLRQQK